MEYTNCCGAPFGTPGWPDCDLCSDCHEHAEPMDETQDHGPPYSMANPTGEPIKKKKKDSKDEEWQFFSHTKSVFDFKRKKKGIQDDLEC